MNSGRSFLFAFALLGLLIMGVAGALAWPKFQLVNHAISANGRVVNLQPEQFKSGTGYHIVFTFKDVSGQKHRIRTTTAYDRPTMHKGDKIEVFYTPEDPQAAQIQSFQTLWEEPTIVGGIGFGIFMVACITLFAGRVRITLSEHSLSPEFHPEDNRLSDFDVVIKEAYPNAYSDIYALGGETHVNRAPIAIEHSF